MVVPPSGHGINEVFERTTVVDERVGMSDQPLVRRLVGRARIKVSRRHPAANGSLAAHVYGQVNDHDLVCQPQGILHAIEQR